MDTPSRSRSPPRTTPGMRGKGTGQDKGTGKSKGQEGLGADDNDDENWGIWRPTGKGKGKDIGKGGKGDGKASD